MGGWMPGPLAGKELRAGMEPLCPESDLPFAPRAVVTWRTRVPYPHLRGGRSALLGEGWGAPDVSFLFLQLLPCRRLPPLLGHELAISTRS